MRLIRSRLAGLQVSLSHAGSGKDALTQVDISIDIDAIKYLEGQSLIDCLHPDILPDVHSIVDEISQVLSETEVRLIGSLNRGVPAENINSSTDYAAGVARLLETDSARFGMININAGDTSINYV